MVSSWGYMHLWRQVPKFQQENMDKSVPFLQLFLDDGDLQCASDLL